MTEEDRVLRWHWHAHRAEMKLMRRSVESGQPRIASCLHAASAQFFKSMLDEIDAMYQDRALRELTR